MHHRHHNHDGDGRGTRPNVVLRVLRRIVFIALLPAMLLAGLIMLPVAMIARLVGIGPRGGCCHRRAVPDPS